MHSWSVARTSTRRPWPASGPTTSDPSECRRGRLETPRCARIWSGHARAADQHRRRARLRRWSGPCRSTRLHAPTRRANVRDDRSRARRTARRADRPRARCGRSRSIASAPCVTTGSGTFGFDLGIYDQAIWLLSRLRDPFITVRGLEAFGHHVNVILLLLAPFYRLGAGPHFLLFVQVVAQASGSVRRCSSSRAIGSPTAGSRCALGVGLPAAPDVAVARVGVLPSGRGRRSGRCCSPTGLRVNVGGAGSRSRRSIALMCKEDVALVIVVIGLLIVWRGDRRIGLGVSVGSLARGTSSRPA